MMPDLVELSAALSSAILHSAWQGCLLALAYVFASRTINDSQARYLFALCLFLAAPVLFVWTFFSTLLESPDSLHYAVTTDITSMTVLVSLAWTIGATAVGSRIFFGWVWLRVVIVRRSIAVPSSVELLFDDAKKALGLTVRIALRASEAVRSPLVTGVFKPVIILPVSLLCNVPPNVITSILTHELMHIRRMDHIAVFVQAFGETLLFYHPAVRWLSAEVRRQREHRCDDDSVRHLGDRYDYARALLAVEESSEQTAMPVLLMNGGETMKRIERLLGTHEKPKASSHFSGLAVFACVGLLVHSLSYGNSSSPDDLQTTQHAHELSIKWLPPSVAQWSEMIEDAAERHDVPADVLALMLLVESHGEVSATSSSGARGLMQVMPETGKKIAETREIADFDTAQLFDPATNIDFGAWYLARMMKRFEGQADRNQELAIAAYNAGPGRVASYLSGDGSLSTETVNYKNLLLAMLSDADKDRSLILEGRKAELRDRLPDFGSPVDGWVSSRFGATGDHKVKHTGVDIVAAMGTPVSAPANGRVKAVGEDASRGKFVTLRHAYGVESRYYHLSEITVQIGDTVTTGEHLGAVGSSGASSGPHLHFEVRELGEPVSPALYGLVLE